MQWFMNGNGGGEVLPFSVGKNRICTILTYCGNWEKCCCYAVLSFYFLSLSGNGSADAVRKEEKQKKHERRENKVDSSSMKLNIYSHNDHPTIIVSL